MAEINAALVKQLRDMANGAPMGKCKKALEENGGDLQKALDALRAANPTMKPNEDKKKAEGGVGMTLAPDGKGVAAVMIECDTDFAARSENFQKLMKTVLAGVLQSKAKDAEAAKALPAVKKELQEATAMTIRENLVLARAEFKQVEGDGRCNIYVHHNGTVGVAVGVSAPAAVAQKPELAALLRDICMHATAHDPAPMAIDKDGIPADLVAREKAVYLKQIDENPADAKKPQNIKEKMVEGRLRKFYEERALLEQKFVKDQELSIRALLDKAGKDLGGALKIQWFIRLAVGG
jgi:elongation factor Ts